MESSDIIDVIKETIKNSPTPGPRQEKYVIVSASLYEHFNLPDKLFIDGIRIIKAHTWDYYA